MPFQLGLTVVSALPGHRLSAVEEVAPAPLRRCGADRLHHVRTAHPANISAVMQLQEPHDGHSVSVVSPLELKSGWRSGSQ